jgi:hypothetical protein
MPQDDPAIASVLNASLISLWYGSEAAVYRGGYLRFKREYLVYIPIRRTFDTTPGR